MTKCKRCGMPKDIFGSFESQTYCLDCVKELRNNKIEEAVEKSNEPVDYQSFSAGDLADAFWNALGRYVKRPNKKDLKKMYDMWLWACHDSHAQSKNFTRALQWCKIDIWEEWARTDIPEE